MPTEQVEAPIQERPAPASPSAGSQAPLRVVLDDMIPEEPVPATELEQHRGSRLVLLTLAGAAVLAGGVLSAGWLASLFQAP